MLVGVGEPGALTEAGVRDAAAAFAGAASWSVRPALDLAGTVDAVADPDAAAQAAVEGILLAATASRCTARTARPRSRRSR